MEKKFSWKSVIGNLDIIVASIALIVLIILTFAGVIMRYIVGHPFTWLEEVQLSHIQLFIFSPM